MVDKVTSVDEFEAEYKKGIGLDQELEAHCEASKDHIAYFADAVGDYNPLWTNEDYAKKSCFGMIIAPPSFFFKVNVATTSVMPPIPGTPVPKRENISSLYAGAEFEMFHPICVGDRFTVKGRIAGVRRVESKTRGAIVFGTGEASYFDQHGTLIGIVRHTVSMVPIVRAGAGGAPPVRVHDKPTPEMAERLEKHPETLIPDILAYQQKRRGAEPRYWEDVEEGQVMEPIEKGVFTATDITRFSLNGHGVLRIFTKPRTEELVVGMAREATSRLQHGVQDPEDFGPQRMSWLVQMVTDWMGDDGTLKKLSGQVRAPNMMGDINVLKGKVAKKYIENGEHLVDLDIWVENQGGNATAPGKATIALPSRRR